MNGQVLQYIDLQLQHANRNRDKMLQKFCYNLNTTDRPITNQNGKTQMMSHKNESSAITLSYHRHNMVFHFASEIFNRKLHEINLTHESLPTALGSALYIQVDQKSSIGKFQTLVSAGITEMSLYGLLAVLCFMLPK